MVHILGHSCFMSVAHAEVILENGNLQTNAHRLKNYLVYFDSENCTLFYINVAVEPYKYLRNFKSG